MRIFSKGTGQVAKLVQDDIDPVPVYKCYLKGRPDNTDPNAHKFQEIEGAAKFLIDNPGSGIRMDPGHAIVSTQIGIDRD